MKRWIYSISLLFLSVWIGVMPQIVHSQERSFTSQPRISIKEMRGCFNKAVAAEKAGKLIEAIESYGKASWPQGYDGKNPVALDAQNGWKRVAQKLGVEAEKKGNLYSEGKGKPYTAQGRSYTVQYNVKENAGAFQWFETIENYADADRVMMKLVRFKPENIETFKLALSHFSLREIRENRQNSNCLKELEAIASKNGDTALEKEEKEFNRKEIIVAEGGPVDRSINQLNIANEWFSFFEDIKEKKVIERAEKRGDSLYADDEEPQSLNEAIEYYSLSNNEEKIKKVMDKANRCGDIYAKKNELMKALIYYEIAKNEAKIKEITGALEKESKKDENMFMLKDTKQQEKFKKEQDDLEKDLGL